MRATFAFLARITRAVVHDVGAFPFSPYPGSELFDQLVASGRITLDEEYFKSLLAYTDPQHRVSYSDFIGSRALSALNLSATAFFSLCSFVLRPWCAEVGACVGQKKGVNQAEGRPPHTTAAAAGDAVGACVVAGHRCRSRGGRTSST